MSHPLGAPGGGRERPRNRPSVVTPALADQDLTPWLIEQIQAGTDVDENSGKLFNLHHKRVIRFFRNRGFSEEDSRDLTQEVFSRVFNAIDTFRQESRFERWLFEIALNLYRNKLRSLRAEKRDAPEVSIDETPEDDSNPGSREPISKEKDALNEIIERERRLALRRGFQELPDQMRKCCELRYVHELKYHEIATVMKISIETVKAHLHQARKRLMDKLGN